MVLLGDAVSCATPLSGMGTSIAMVGAFTLAGEMKTAGTAWRQAFVNYEVHMRDFVAEAQKMADSIGWFVPKTRFKLWFSRKMWSLMPQSTLRELMIDQPDKIANSAQLKDYTS